MTSIRYVAHPVDGEAREPRFPATDQHPDAVRYRIGEYYVDAIGGEPTAAEVEAFINPPRVERTVDQKLAVLGLTREDLQAALVKAPG